MRFFDGIFFTIFCAFLGNPKNLLSLNFAIFYFLKYVENLFRFRMNLTSKSVAVSRARKSQEAFLFSSSKFEFLSSWGFFLFIEGIGFSASEENFSRRFPLFSGFSFFDFLSGNSPTVSGRDLPAFRPFNP